MTPASLSTPLRPTRQFWTAEEDTQLRARYPHERTADIARDLGRTRASIYARADITGLSKSTTYLASPAACRTNGRQGMGTRFQKGHATWNKGTTFHAGGRSVETQFQNGERRGIAAKNWRPVGTILTDTEGYLRVKVREAGRDDTTFGFGNVRIWPLLQRHVWTQAHGPIPPGDTVCFKDGDKTNCALDNLELVSRRDLMKRNSVHNYPKPVAETIQLLGALRRQINKRAHGEEQDSRPA